jgi:hypothetical protein
VVFDSECFWSFWTTAEPHMPPLKNLKARGHFLDYTVVLTVLQKLALFWKPSIQFSVLLNGHHILSIGSCSPPF